MKKFLCAAMLCIAAVPVTLAGTFEEEMAKFAGSQTIGISNPTEAITTIYDNAAGTTLRAFSSTDLNAIYGDQLSTVGTGLLSEHTLGVFNSGSSAGPITGANINVGFYINDNPTGLGTFISGYSGSFTVPGGLAPGFFTTLTFTGLDGLGINLAPNTNIVVAQQLQAITGGANRTGVVSADPVAIGSSIPQVYLNATTVGAPGFYNITASGVPVNFNLLHTVKINAPDPVLVVSPPGGVQFGNVRVGTTSGPLNATASNGGAVGSTLTGSFGTISGEFNGGGGSFSLGAALGSSTSFTYTPSARGADTGSVPVSSDGGNGTVDLGGTGVGPVYADDAEGGCIDVGDIYSGQTSMASFNISNITGDGNLGGLTDLTIVSASIIGSDGNALWSTDLTSGTVIPAGGNVMVNIFADYAGNPQAAASAQLFLETDQGTFQLGDGDDFLIDLCGYAVPEPSSIALGILGAVAIAGMARKRRSA